MVEKMKELYGGKSKTVYATDVPNLLLCEFRNSATAFDGKKKGEIDKKGFHNANISAKIFQLLESKGIPTHFVKMVNENKMVVKKLKIVPVEVVIRRKVAGSMAKALGLEEGMTLKRPVMDLYYKSDELHDPKISDDYAIVLGYADEKTLKEMKEMAWKVCDIITDLFAKAEIDLVDFKLEFGWDENGKVVLGDEISPDGCRLWDLKTQYKLDKDRFRRDLGKVEDAYAEVWKRISKVLN